MNGDFYYVLHWWFVLFLFGTAFLPLTTCIFRNFFDKGYIFSKTLGLAVVSYLVFLSGTLHITPFTQYTVGGFLILCAVGNVLLIWDKKYFAPTTIKKFGLIFLIEEGMFFLALWFWSYIRGFEPSIHALEKFMDFGFVNSILRSTYLPPKDMWFTPLPINYYYFGHFVTAVLTKFSGISSNITFNLMLATLFGFCFTCSFSLAANMWRAMGKGKRFFAPISMITGLLSAILVTFGGNLHILYAFFKSYGNDTPVPLWTLPFLPGTFPNAYWYPNATRFIYHTIHEFPIYSFVVSDLHGHVLDIPFVLLTIAFLFSLISNKQYENNFLRIGNWKLFFDKLRILSLPNGEIGNLLFIGFLLAVMYMTNAWDGLMYFLLTSVVLAVILKRKLQGSFFENIFIWQFLLRIGIIFVCFFLFSLPFSHFFEAGEIVHGIGVLCSPKFLTDKGHIGPFLFEANHCQHSPWWQLATLYGFFYLWAIPFMIFLWRKRKEKQVISDVFVLLLILFSTFLIIVPEFFYLKDIYPEHYRANTMFKLVYQAFIMLSLSSGYIIVRFFFILKGQKLQTKRSIITICYTLYAICLTVLVSGAYPYLAITSYYNNLKTYQSLDGTKYLQPLYPTDYDAINWINKHISGQPIILEAQGDSYTDYARVSANTGLATVLGWTVHEWLWRGSYDVPAPRITDVQTMYTTSDITTTKLLLKEYHVSYVFIGDMERKKYPTLDIDKFNTLGKIIYKNGSTMIYKTL